MKTTETESINTYTKDLDLMPLSQMADIMAEESIKAATCVKYALPSIKKTILQVEKVYLQGGHIFFTGAGTAGRMGILEAVECPPTFSVPYNLFNGLLAGGKKAIWHSIEGAEDDAKQGAKDFLQKATKKDMLIAITASGTTPYALGALEAGKKLGVPTVLISNNKTAITKNADIFIYLPSGPEVITGSTRLKAGTSQKLALNMITTLAMVRVGKVYKNYMIDVRASNIKLKKRTIRLISIASEISLEEAEILAKKTNYQVKPAVLMAKKGLTFKQATDLLKKHKGFLRKALNEK